MAGEVPRPKKMAGQAEGRQQTLPLTPVEVACSPHPAPCTAYIHSLQNSISGQGGGGGSSQLITRSFPQCVHSSLAVSCDLVSLPGPSALPPPSTPCSPRDWDPSGGERAALACLQATAAASFLPSLGQKSIQCT